MKSDNVIWSYVPGTSIDMARHVLGEAVKKFLLENDRFVPENPEKLTKNYLENPEKIRKKDIENKAYRKKFDFMINKKKASGFVIEYICSKIPENKRPEWLKRLKDRSESKYSIGISACYEANKYVMSLEGDDLPANFVDSSKLEFYPSGCIGRKKIHIDNFPEIKEIIEKYNEKMPIFL